MKYKVSFYYGEYAAIVSVDQRIPDMDYDPETGFEFEGRIIQACLDLGMDVFITVRELAEEYLGYLAMPVNEESLQDVLDTDELFQFSMDNNLFEVFLPDGTYGFYPGEGFGIELMPPNVAIGILGRREPPRYLRFKPSV